MHDQRRNRTIIDLIGILTTFVLFAAAAHTFGKSVTTFGLPLISGFLFAGLLAGPYLLGIFDAAAVTHLHFIDEFALAFIAFAAGGELDLRLVRNYLRQITAIILASTCVVMVLGTLAFLLLAGWLPFMHGMTAGGVLAVALIGATIMLARSPSSAFAIIKELRARGPFTQTVLGVTVLMDAGVIMMFTVCVSIADVLIEGAPFNVGLLFFLAFEILLDILLGVGVSQILRAILALPCGKPYKTALVLLSGYLIFYLSAALHEVHLGPLPVGIFSEPLLIGLVTGFTVANYTRYGSEFRRLVEDISPGVLLFFFTLVGISLELEVLAQTWAIALILLAIRLLSIYSGTFLGSIVAGNGMTQHAILGMSFITQAGVSIGLAKEVGVAFPAWGGEFATFVIAVIVLNQIIGPPCLKWALFLAGEAHPRAEPSAPEGEREVMIFGIDEQSLTLARQLKAHNWHVRLADIEAGRVTRLVWPEVEAYSIPALTPDTLRELKVDKVDTIVAMLDDDANYTICELAYEHFGTAHLVVRLYDRGRLGRFQALGALIVDPDTAMINLLDHYVRSPSVTALLLGQEVDQDVIEVTVSNPALHGVALRDLYLPEDTVILSIRRQGRLLLTHDYTRLETGDAVTIVGAPDHLEDLQWRFHPFPHYS